MIEGSYSLNLNTPMGNIPCMVNLWFEGKILNGKIEIMGSKNFLKGGKAEDNKCFFEGEINTPLGNISYKILGIIEGDKINIFAETNKGNFNLNGNRIK
ncbi:MAG: hypothetical protein IKP28_01505 [Clostridia bacterium]|nr:hypothetical protein [Clostridia bacterium]